MYDTNYCMFDLWTHVLSKWTLGEAKAIGNNVVSIIVLFDSVAFEVGRSFASPLFNVAKLALV